MNECGRKTTLNYGQQPLCQKCPHLAETEWKSLGKTDIVTLNQAKTMNTYNPGQLIFLQGNQCMGLYSVYSGTVVVRRVNVHGNAVIVRLVEAGQTLGYRAFFSSNSFYTASAEATTRTQVCFLSRTNVDNLIRNNPSVALNFLRRLANDLNSAESFRLRFATLPVTGRVAQILLLLKRHHGTVDQNGNIIIDLPMARRDLANMIDARPESVSRAVTSLHKRGVATFTKRRVTITDLDDLIDEVETGS